MTIIEFATTNLNDARRFLDHEQMSYLTDTSREYILDGVKQGICRVRDPQMYGGASGLVPATTDRDVWDPWIHRFKELHDADWDSRPQTVSIPRGDMPDGYEIEWGKRLYHDDGESFISWYEDKPTWEEDAREAGEDGYFRYVGPAQNVNPQGVDQ